MTTGTKMDTEIIKLPIEEFTTTKVDGDGIFDQLMQANKAHLEQEFQKNRIKGPEYATVYLGSLEQTMQTALQFFIEGRKSKLEEKLIEKQIELADKQLDMADCEQALCRANISKVNAETAMITAQMEKIPHEIALAQAQADIAAEQVLIAKEELLIAKANLVKIPAEIANIEANTTLLGKQVDKLTKDILQVTSQTSLIDQQTVNAKTENITMQKQQCKLDAEFDLLVLQKGKVGSETALLTQKVATEAAQVSSGGVDPNSVIGRQKALYVAQTDGFQRNAEHQVAKLMADTWAVQRTTDEGVQPGGAGLGDAEIRRAINKALSGVQA